MLGKSRTNGSGSIRQPSEFGDRACHTIGIPMIAIAILMIPVAIWLPQCWWWALGLFVAGWIFQFIGHAFEGKTARILQGLALLVCRPELVVRQTCSKA